MSNLPASTSPVFASDEDCLVRAGGDFATLCPPWQQMAAGTDGVFASGTPWVLTSATINFQQYGVAPNQVIWLTAPKAVYPGGGQFLAIDSIAGNALTLRRPHKDLNVGQPAGPIAGVTGVTFAINTLDPQIEEASYTLKKRFTIIDDGSNAYRSSSWVYDLREFRIATVLTVLLDRYTQETRTSKGDFNEKIARIRVQLDDVIDRIQVQWGAFGNSAEPSTLFGCKVSR